MRAPIEVAGVATPPTNPALCIFDAGFKVAHCPSKLDAERLIVIRKPREQGMPGVLWQDIRWQ